jgi:DNA-binding response OmpR family regulator
LAASRCVSRGSKHFRYPADAREIARDRVPSVISSLDDDQPKTRRLLVMNVTTDHRRLPDNMLAPPRILIVDDNPIHASLVKRALQDQSTKIGRLRCEIDVVEDLATARKYLLDDSIDIYFLDLELSEIAGDGVVDISVGSTFVHDVVEATNAGIIICSTFAAETEAARLLELGADDYVEKAYGDDEIAARTYSVWRRTIRSRPKSAKAHRFAHNGRKFVFSGWHFVVGNRTLTNAQGAELKISPTEHAFLTYLVVVDGNSIDSETFNVDVLDRDQHRMPIRLDNFVYRLRKKFSGKLELDSQGGGIYKLFDVRELKPTS